MFVIDSKNLLIQRKCPICQEDRYRNIFSVKADPFYFERFDIRTASIVQCRSCGMRYTNPVLKLEIDALQYLESEGYNPQLIESSEPFYWEDQIICFREFSESPAIKSKRLLDIGCGEGGLVYLCQKNGFDAHGVELNKNAVNRASLAGIRNISDSNLKEIESNSFNVVTVIHVLEHLHDCRNFIEHIKRILKPKGVVMGMVPNYFSFQYRFRERQYWNYPFQHMNGFTVDMLDRLFSDLGFKRFPLMVGYTKRYDGLGLKTRISMAITKMLGNSINLFPTKLFCLYQK